MNRKIFIWTICLLLITLFTYAAIAKISDYPNFEFGLSESPFIWSFAGFLAWAIPASEFIISGLLLWSFTRLAGLYASMILMLLFTIYIGAMLLFGSEIPCSCGGVLEEMSWPVHLLFNAFFAVLSFIGIMLEHKKRKSKIFIDLTNLTYAEGYSSAADPH